MWTRILFFFREGYTIADAGILHNGCVDFIDSDFINHDWDEMEDLEEEMAILHGIAEGFLAGELETDLSGTNNATFLLNLMGDLNGNDYLEDAVDSARARIVRYSALNSYELSLFDRMVALYETNFGASSNSQVINRILDSFDLFVNLIETYPEHYVRPDFFATAYVGQGSASYWKNLQGYPGGIPDTVPSKFVLAFDGVGYLVSWTTAWLADQGPEYSNDIDAQLNRIGRGLTGAAGASFIRGKWFKKRYG